VPVGAVLHTFGPVAHLAEVPKNLEDGPMEFSPAKQPSWRRQGWASFLHRGSCVSKRLV